MANKDQQAELEQAAREWLLENMLVVTIEDTASLARLLADQRVTMLEEVADEMARHPYWSKEAEVWIKHIRQQAQEQRP